MTIRVRISELMKERGFASAYELAKAAHGRIQERTIYRLVEKDGLVKNFSADTLEALAEVFGVSLDQLLEHTPKAGSRGRK